MKLYDLVRAILKDNPDTRKDDKLLVWIIWKQLGYVSGGVITYENFINHKHPSPDTITRTARQVKEDHEELRPPNYIIQARKRKQKTKGMFVYHEKVDYEYDEVTKTARIK